MRLSTFSRPFDGVCIIVAGCMAALSDALIRKITTDEPSEACAHLTGRTLAGRQLGFPGFGVSISSFATQVCCPLTYSAFRLFSQWAVEDANGALSLTMNFC